MSAVLTRTRRGPVAAVLNLCASMLIRWQLHWLENDCEHLEHDIRDNPERLRIKQLDMASMRFELSRLRGY